ncbi:MAG: hypothetical protein KA116_11000 [Proteobacteria bacterium]|nr:hypothetical protein [Pseudomonadota bacterium]
MKNFKNIKLLILLATLASSLKVFSNGEDPSCGNELLISLSQATQEVQAQREKISAKILKVKDIKIVSELLNQLLSLQSAAQRRLDFAKSQKLEHKELEGEIAQIEKLIADHKSTLEFPTEDWQVAQRSQMSFDRIKNLKDKNFAIQVSNHLYSQRKRPDYASYEEKLYKEIDNVLEQQKLIPENLWLELAIHFVKKDKMGLKGPWLAWHLNRLKLNSAAQTIVWNEVKKRTSLKTVTAISQLTSAYLTLKKPNENSFNELMELFLKTHRTIYQFGFYKEAPVAQLAIKGFIAGKNEEQLADQKLFRKVSNSLGGYTKSCFGIYSWVVLQDNSESAVDTIDPISQALRSAMYNSYKSTIPVLAAFLKTGLSAKDVGIATKWFELFKSKGFYTESSLKLVAFIINLGALKNPTQEDDKKLTQLINLSQQLQINSNYRLTFILNAWNLSIESIPETVNVAKELYSCCGRDYDLALRMGFKVASRYTEAAIRSEKLQSFVVRAREVYSGRYYDTKDRNAQLLVSAGTF